MNDRFINGERLYRLLLRLYPAPFRERFEPQLLEAFREQRRDPKYGHALGRLSFWTDILWDLAKTLSAARRRYVSAIPPLGPDVWATKGAIRTTEAVVDGLKQDFKFAVRTLSRAPAFALIAVLTLAIGIGSNAAIFGVVNSVLLRPLPYGDADRVVTIWSRWVGFPQTWVSLAEYRTYLTQTQSFEDLTLWFNASVNFSSQENPERVRAIGATENLVEVLGVEMAAGRYFTREEALRSDTLPSETIVISNEVWARRYASDPGIVGRTVEVSGRAREVIGVLPAGFRLPTDFGTLDVPDVYFPYYLDRTPVTSYPRQGGSHGFYVAGRLSPGVTEAAARRDVQNVIDRMRVEFDAYPASMQFEPLLFSAQDDVLGDIRPALFALFGTVVFVLLIACANVANLLLTRSQVRQSEMAVRVALGAGRVRIVRQLLVESLVLAMVGGILGVALAYGGVELFRDLNPGNLPRIDEVAIDATVLGFGVLVTLVTAVLFGTLPALRSGSSELRESMGSRGDRGVGKSGWQGTLVALEMALAVVLVMGAGLMVRTFGALSAIDVGFHGDDVLTMAVSLPAATYPTAQDNTDFHREAMRRMEEIPGVRMATAARIIPLASQIGDWGLRIENYQAPEGLPQNGDWQFAAPGYFEAMGIPLVAGRTFGDADNEAGMGVAIVNEAFTRHFWPNGEDPIGQRFRMGGGGSQQPWVTIVGVVGDVTHNGLRAEIKRKFYIPLAQWSTASGNRPSSVRFVVQTAGDPTTYAADVRDVIRSMDPTLAVAEVQTVDDILSSAVAQPRFTLVLMGAFSLIAILLALVGVYGVISYGVEQKTQEIGIRMALGAERDHVVLLMLKRGAAMVGVGLAVGVLAALGLTRFLESMLYGVSAQDPVTFAGVAIGFVFMAWLATYLPSRRAARVDPIRALRYD